MKIEINPIGKIHSPFKEPEGMPIQPTGANGVQGIVEIFDKFQAGLKDLDGTPLLDIKPYVQDFDRPQKVRSGWLAHSRDKVSIKKSDD